MVSVANSSEEVQCTTDGDIEYSSQAVTQFPQPPALSRASLIVGLVSGGTGMCANAFVLVVLLFARRQFGSSVNTLITHQSAMDFFACVFLAISFGLSFPGAVQNYLVLSEAGNNLVCFLFRSRVLSIMTQNAEKIGLAVISVWCIKNRDVQRGELPTVLGMITEKVRVISIT